MSKKRRGRRKKESGSLGWIYIIISALSAALSLCLFCSVSYILTELGAIRPTERFGEGLFFFCAGPLLLAVLIGTVAILMARRHRGKLAPADEYIDAGVSSLTETEESHVESETEPGDEPGGKTLSE